MIKRNFLLPLFVVAALSACSDSDDNDDPVSPAPSPADPSPAPAPDDQPGNPGIPAPLPDNPPAAPGSVFQGLPDDIGDVDTFYDQDGYAEPGVIRVDIRTVTVPGICTQEDQSGCTLADVIADTNNKDDFKVEIPVHFKSSDFADDGSINNATLRQRGNSARQAPQKSFRIKLDDKDTLWRSERRLQLNKHPFDASRIKNKLSFDLIRTLPHFPSLRTQFVNLWIDDGAGPTDYGLFTHVEFAAGKYLDNRGLGENDNLYKIEFFEFSAGDLNFIKVDGAGAPVDEKLFETRLEIENGDDHTNVFNMLSAMTDSGRSFDSILDQYFNRNNVLMWITANLLMHQTDAITQNFYLYNPQGSEKFYFLPWDYDGTFEVESELTNSFDNTALAKRKFYGYARGLNSQFVARYYKQPGAHQRILQAADEIRRTYLSDAQIMARAEILNRLAEPFLTSLPDSQHGRFEVQNPQLFANAVARVHNAMQNDFAVPMPPTLQPAEFGLDGSLLLSWTPAYDVTQTNTLTYDIELSTSYLFEPENIVYSDSGISDASDLITYSLGTGGLPSGQLFVRLIARGSLDPQRYWQTASNFHRLEDGTDRFGIAAITIP